MNEQAMSLIQNKPVWQWMPHLLASHITEGRWKNYKFLEFISVVLTAVIGQKNGRLIVEIPPQYGKSTLISLWTPVWFLTNWPHKRVILTTYESDYAR